VFSPTIINELHAGLVRLKMQTVAGGINGTDALHQVAGVPDMDWDGGQGMSAMGPPVTSPSLGVTNRLSVGDDVILTKGRIASTSASASPACSRTPWGPTTAAAIGSSSA